MEPLRKDSDQPQPRIAVPSGSFWTISGVTLLIGIISILTLSFQSDAWQVWHDVTRAGTISDFTLGGGDIDLAYYPLNLHLDTIKPTLAAAGISLIVAVVMGILLWSAYREKEALTVSFRFRLIVWVVVACSSALNLLICLTNVVSRIRSDTFDPKYRSPAIAPEQGYGLYGKYDIGDFDLGSWTCQVSGYRDNDSDHHSILHRQCVDSTAVLWLMALLSLLSTALAVLLWADWRGQRILFKDYEKVLDDDYV